MTTKQIQALGHYLAFYATDLNYIRNFQKYKQSSNNIEYSVKGIGSFYSFLVEFRVIRNITKGSTKIILDETVDWVNGSNPDDVDGFARKLFGTGLTHKKVPTSMASKILFLNNPWEIIPMDSLARKTLGQNVNSYSIYIKNLEKYSLDNRHIIDEHGATVSKHIELIHKDFPELINLNKISRNRMLDKLLWASGK